MDKNCVRRRRAPGELAIDSEAPKGSKPAPRKRSKDPGKAILPYPGRDPRCVLEMRLRRSRGFLTASQKSVEAEVVDGVTDHPMRSGKPDHRAKGRTVKNWVEGIWVTAKAVEI